MILYYWLGFANSIYGDWKCALHRYAEVPMYINKVWTSQWIDTQTANKRNKLEKDKHKTHRSFDAMTRAR